MGLARELCLSRAALEGALGEGLRKEQSSGRWGARNFSCRVSGGARGRG